MSRLKNVCAIIVAVTGAACATQPPGAPEQPDYITMERAGVAVTITPAFGGRVTGFGLAGRDSLVLFDAALAAEQPDPPVEISTAALPYQGQSLWVGPQDEWWTHQTVAPDMQGESWPPDPYLTAAKTRVTRTPYSVPLEGSASPYTGLKVRQTYELLESGCLKLTAFAENMRQRPVSWDLWTNIRVPGDTWVFAPVGGAAAIRPGPTNDPAFQPPELGYSDGLAFADPSMDGVTAPAREGKVFLDTDEGWMAGVRDGQAFRVSFALSPLAAIHPAQGQVEFYFNQPSDQSGAGVIEMETHAPYRTLQPGETMQAVQFWSAQPVSDANLSSDQLNSLARELEERDACQQAYPD
jgi:hypothetical protein